jgi:hypothetical protein
MLAFLAAGESSTLSETEDGRFLRLEALSSTEEVLVAIITVFRRGQDS